MTRAILSVLMLSGCAAVQCEMEKDLIMDAYNAQAGVCVGAISQKQQEITALRAELRTCQERQP